MSLTPDDTNLKSTSSTTSISSSATPLPMAAVSPADSLSEDPLVAAKLAALASPCFFHRRIDDAVDIQDILNDESVSQSRLLQTVTSVREAARQLQRRPMRRAVRNLMIITKARDNDLVLLTRELTEWLLATPRYGSPLGVTVYVDHKLRNSKRFNASGLLAKDARYETMLKYWTPDMCWSHPEKFDLVLTLGGDGTVLFTSWLFQRIVPPVLSFSLGSLGFLTPFDFGSYRKHLDQVMGGVTGSLPTTTNASASTSLAPSAEPCIRSLSLNDVLTPHPNSPFSQLLIPPTPDLTADAGASMRVNLRMRFTCSVWRQNPSTFLPSQRPSYTETASFEVLNELVIDRGPSPYVSNLELYACDHDGAAVAVAASQAPASPLSIPPMPHHHNHSDSPAGVSDNLLTVIQADGVIFSTPTGSTAYSLSAGGSLVHPDIPAILLTPICPHTLSFRPMLLDDAMALRVAVPRGSRATAWCSFDGKGRVELRQGDYVSISASRYPFPVVEGGGRGRERWIDTVSKTLRWNTREARQKAWTAAKGQTEAQEEEEEEEQEPEFDIEIDDVDDDEEKGSAKDSGYGGEMSALAMAMARSGSGGGGSVADTRTATPVRRRSAGGGVAGLGC